MPEIPFNVMISSASTGNSTLDAVIIASSDVHTRWTAELFMLLGIGSVFTVLQTFGRIFVSGIKGLDWDDYLAWMAAAWNGAMAATAYHINITYAGIANDSMSDEHRAVLSHDPRSPEYMMRVNGSKMQLGCWIAYAMVLWCLKGSLLYFFLGRLTVDLQGQSMRILMGAGVLVGSWLILIMATFLSCRPFSRMWQIYPDPGETCYAASSPALLWTYFACNILTDLHLLSIPIPILLRASLPPRQKATLICVFGCTILITLVATVRLVLIKKDSNQNADGEWAVRELFVAIITTNLASVVPLFRRWLSLGTEASDTFYLKSTPTAADRRSAAAAAAAAAQRRSARDTSSSSCMDGDSDDGDMTLVNKNNNLNNNLNNNRNSQARTTSSTAYLTRKDLVYSYHSHSGQQLVHDGEEEEEEEEEARVPHEDQSGLAYQPHSSKPQPPITYV